MYIYIESLDQSKGWTNIIYSPEFKDEVLPGNYEYVTNSGKIRCKSITKKSDPKKIFGKFAIAYRVIRHYELPEGLIRIGTHAEVWKSDTHRVEVIRYSYVTSSFLVIADRITQNWTQDTFMYYINKWALTKYDRYEK